MTLPVNTGIKFFGQKILIESTDEPDVDKALKSVFYDDYIKVAPLTICDRADVQLVLSWSRMTKEQKQEFRQEMQDFREK